MLLIRYYQIIYNIISDQYQIFHCYSMIEWILLFIILDDDSFASERDAQSTDDNVTTFIFNAQHSQTLKSQRESLPIKNYENHILYCLENYQTLILIGETGCGKSTQVPQVS